MTARTTGTVSLGGKHIFILQVKLDIRGPFAGVVRHRNAGAGHLVALRLFARASVWNIALAAAIDQRSIDPRGDAPTKQLIFGSRIALDRGLATVLSLRRLDLKGLHFKLGAYLQQLHSDLLAEKPFCEPPTVRSLLAKILGVVNHSRTLHDSLTTEFRWDFSCRRVSNCKNDVTKMRSTPPDRMPIAPCDKEVAEIGCRASRAETASTTQTCPRMFTVP